MISKLTTVRELVVFYAREDTITFSIIAILQSCHTLAGYLQIYMEISY